MVWVNGWKVSIVALILLSPKPYHSYLVLYSRKPILVNLDPANCFLPYEAAVDIKNLVTVDEIMKSKGLGPNGALIQCISHLENNLEWLDSQLLRFENGNCLIYIYINFVMNQIFFSRRWCVFYIWLSWPSRTLYAWFVYAKHHWTFDEARLSISDG